MSISKAIVIGTTPSTQEWLNNLLLSLNGWDKYQIIVLSDYTYELGKIKWIYDNTTIDEFFFLQDSIEIKNPEIFESGFNYPGSISWDSGFKSYLGKYRREILNKCHLPVPKTKLDSVNYEESFNYEYISKETIGKSLHDNFSRSDKFEEKFGRVNMVLEDEYIKKYKHIWCRDMVPLE